MAKYAGQVARIRVTPTDFLSVVDVVDALGMRQPGMSFSSMVSIALSSCLEGLRQNGTIPEREGFEFGRIRDDVMQKRDRRALFITDKFQSRTSDFRIAAPPRNSVHFMKTAEELLSQNGTEVLTAEDLAEIRENDEMLRAQGITPPVRDEFGRIIKAAEPREGHRANPPKVNSGEEKVSLEMRQARTRLAELNAKKELFDDGHPGISWSAGDQREFDELMKVVYG